MGERSVAVTYFSDLLCVWAYVAQVRLDELRRRFGARVSIDHRFVSIFGDTATRIGARWSDRGGFEGYADHVREVVGGFEHVEVHPDVWRRDAPAGSYAPHVFVRAAALALDDGELEDPQGARPLTEELAWRLRLAFFRDLRNVAREDVQLEVAESIGLAREAILDRIRDGRAHAALAADHEAAAGKEIAGSPTFLMNDGRQKLYGNVGYRVIEANVEELLRDARDGASWC
jgi:predicted DsbA family dithiol-disulfide isomerase